MVLACVVLVVLGEADAAGGELGVLPERLGKVVNLRGTVAIENEINKMVQLISTGWSRWIV